MILHGYPSSAAGSGADVRRQDRSSPRACGSQLQWRGPASRRSPSRHHQWSSRPLPFGRDNLLQQPEMLVDEVEGCEVTDALIEFGGILEIAEQESQAQDLEALADGERVGPVDIAQSLVGEETRCR